MIVAPLQDRAEIFLEKHRAPECMFDTDTIFVICRSKPTSSRLRAAATSDAITGRVKEHIYRTAKKRRVLYQ